MAWRLARGGASAQTSRTPNWAVRAASAIALLAEFPAGNEPAYQRQRQNLYR
jgi:hypothetical protein